MAIRMRLLANISLNNPAAWILLSEQTGLHGFRSPGSSPRPEGKLQESLIHKTEMENDWLLPMCCPIRVSSLSTIGFVE